MDKIMFKHFCQEKMKKKNNNPKQELQIKPINKIQMKH